MTDTQSNQEEEQVSLPNVEGSDPRGVAFFSALIDAWINTRMERDKQVLTLSSLGLGGLMAFGPSLESPSQCVLWLSSGICFLASIAALLHIFKINSDLIEKHLAREQTSEQDGILKSLDYIGIGGFYVGAVLMFSLAIAIFVLKI